MKIKQAHYATLKANIAEIWTQHKNDCHRQSIINEGKARDVEKRLRNDWLHFAGLSMWVGDNLYPYMDDTHIDTALRHIMSDLSA